MTCIVAATTASANDAESVASDAEAVASEAVPEAVNEGGADTPTGSAAALDQGGGTIEGSGEAETGAAAETKDAGSVEASKGAAGSQNQFDFVADGQRVEVQKRGFSIVAPKGWEVTTNHPNLSFLAQIPWSANIKYRRTIQIAGFSGPRYMDEVTAKDFEKLIVKNFAESSASVTDFKIRNNLPIELADGRPGLLFYSEFMMDDVALMQAHILVSDPNTHLLMTYTDVREHFENEEAAGKFLSEAWDAMVSLQMPGPAPVRFAEVKRLGIFALGVLLVAFSLWGLRSWLGQRSLRHMEQDLELDGRDEDKDFASQHGTGHGLQGDGTSAHSDISGFSSTFESRSKKLKPTPPRQVAAKPRPGEVKPNVTSNQAALPTPGKASPSTPNSSKKQSAPQSVSTPVSSSGRFASAFSSISGLTKEPETLLPPSQPERPVPKGKKGSFRSKKAKEVSLFPSEDLKNLKDQSKSSVTGLSRFDDDESA